MNEFFEVYAKSMHSKFNWPDKFKNQMVFFQLVFLIILLNVCPNPVFAQNEKEEFILSPRVGLEIDSNEVEYFNIFPDLNNVKGVIYKLDNFMNLRMLVSLANGKDTTIMFSKLGVEELRTYINKHEILADSQNIVNWDLLPGYGISKMNFFERHGSIVFVHCDSVVYSGKLLRVTDNELILWTSTQPFRPETWNVFSKKIPIDSIDKIERKQDLTGKIFGITLGAGIGAALLNIGFSVFNSQNLSVENTLYLVAGGGVIGAGLGWFYDKLTLSRRKYRIFKNRDNFLKNRPNLEKRAIFTSIYPPELKNL